MTTIDLPLVQDCSVSECSYNNNGCAAGAVTIGYGRTCATFVPLSVRGGLEPEGRLLLQYRSGVHRLCDSRGICRR